VEIVPFLSPFVRDLWGVNLCIHLAWERKKKYPTLLKRGGCLSGQRHGFYLHFVVVVLELSLLIGLHSFRDCIKLPTTMMQWVRLSCVRSGCSCLLIAKMLFRAWFGHRELLYAEFECKRPGVESEYIGCGSSTGFFQFMCAWTACTKIVFNHEKTARSLYLKIAWEILEKKF